MKHYRQIFALLAFLILSTFAGSLEEENPALRTPEFQPRDEPITPPKDEPIIAPKDKPIAPKDEAAEETTEETTEETPILTRTIYIFAIPPLPGCSILVYL